MAGHSKFKNIQHRKGAQDRRRAKVFTKLVRDIIIATKNGIDPNTNPKLKNALATARANNLPKERIEKALNHLLNSENDNLTEIRYEGFAPGGIAFIIETLTDNRNRTASEIRFAFSKFGGNLGETGSVSFMFDHCGIIKYPVELVTQDKIFELTIEAGASDMETMKEYHYIYTKVENFNIISEYLINKIGNPAEAEIGWRAKNIIETETLEKVENLEKFIDFIEDYEDVQTIYYNCRLQ